MQKSIRRGDLDLCKTSFDLLWNDPKQRQWLKWRIYTLVIEEAFYLSAELYDFLETKTNEEKDWRKFIYQLCLAPKSKDNVALYSIKKNNYKYYIDKLSKDSSEAALFFSSFAGMDFVNGDPSKLCDNMLEFVATVSDVPFTEYEQKSVDICVSRAKMGGMTGDRLMSVVAIFLIKCRGLCKENVDSALKNSVNLWYSSIKSRRKPISVDLPWYSFDQHTQVGKIALGIFMKNQAKKFNIASADDIKRLWFWSESAYSPEYLVPVCADTNSPTVYENAYFYDCLSANLSQFGGDLSEVKKLWDNSVKSAVAGCVEWLLGKRLSESN